MPKKCACRESLCILGSSPNFPQTAFLFFGLSPPHHPTPIVWTNCVAYCPFRQFEKVCSFPFFSPFLNSLSKHSLIACVFLNAKNNMSVYFLRVWVQGSFCRFNLKRMIFFNEEGQCFQFVVQTELKEMLHLCLEECKNNKGGYFIKAEVRFIR